ncbi:MAG: AAA family ATPase [Candidatus Omnitrophica bacterium]|nr:AAA family ATPase [Candidatus Omnitrophota bacterium]
MNVISVLNQKGGCGKTITAVNLSAGLSKKGHKVLLIDLDPQGHASFALSGNTEVTIADIAEKVAVNEPFELDKCTTVINDNFSLISSSIGLASLEHKLSNNPDKLKIIAMLASKYLKEFEYVVVDCPPNLGILTLNSLVASNYALIPLMACDFSLQGMEILKNIMIMVKEFNGTSPTPFFLLNQVDNRSTFSRDFIQKVKNRLDRLLLKSSIRTNVHLREAASKGKNIFDYKPKSRGAEDFSGLTDEIVGITNRNTWASLFLKGKDFDNVYVVGDFNNWKLTEAYRLNRVSSDIWSINLPLEKGTYRYKFVASNKWFPDPYNKLTENDHFGGRNSLIVAK